MSLTLDDRYRGGVACRDGHAAQFERETGKSWYAHISKGRKPRRRFYSTRGTAALPAGEARTSYGPEASMA